MKGDVVEREAFEKHTNHICDEMGAGEGSKGLDKPFVREAAEH